MTREEAIEIVKKHGISADGTKFESALRELIPELRESEDERMMREFNDWLCEEIECLTNDLRDEEDRRTLNMLCYVLTKVKDWLEKQKEQKPSGETNVEPDSKIPREEYLYHLLANNIITFTDYTYLLAKKPFDYECANIPQKDYTPVEQKSADLSEMMVHKEPYIAPVPTPMVADEQKPAEWSDEDEKTLVSVICGELELSDSRKEYFINLLKSIRPHQPKSEWSEEDERMFSRCIKSIETSKQFADSDTFKAAKDKEIAWLKSIRPQPKRDCKDCAMFLNGKCTKPHWKPSDEQMKALEECGECKRCIKNLYEQLKGL